MEKEAIALIAEAAQEPSLDELAARARTVMALKEPSDADLRVWIAHWRAQRAAWNSRKDVMNEEK